MNVNQIFNINNKTFYYWMSYYLLYIYIVFSRNILWR